MPTTVQAYPHSTSAYLRNLARGRNGAALLKYVMRLRWLESWVELGKQLFHEAMEHGGIWHLYGHSWEIEELNLWDGLREVLDHVSHRRGIRYLNNGQLVQ
jgi:hypothetical protein